MAMCVGGALSDDAAKASSLLTEYQGNAWRTLGFAVERMDSDGGLNLAGVVGIADPVRPDVKEAIETCRKRAGVKVIVTKRPTVKTQTAFSFFKFVINS